MDIAPDMLYLGLEKLPHCFEMTSMMDAPVSQHV